MKFLKSILPPNTIAGKLARGDNKGALSSAVNYVKSGEILTDVKNISSGNVMAIASKGLGSSTASLLNKKPSEVVKTSNLSGGTSQASTQGSTASIYGVIDKTPSSSSSSDSPNNKSDNSTVYYLIGAAALLFFIMKK